MPINGDEIPSPGSREAWWWNKAKNFVISKSPMYDVSDNAKVDISDSSSQYHVNITNILIGNPPTPGTSGVEQRRAQEPDQQSYHPDVPLPAQDSVGSRGEAQITPVQPCAPTEAQDNGSKDRELQITLDQLPTALQPNSGDLSALPPDSEATAEYTEPDVPSISFTSYPYTSRARSHIYSFEMLTHRAGYPLYMPTPLGGLSTAYRRKGIRVGDVGVITAKSAFEFLFNACKYNDQSNAGINPDTLPDGFELLKPSIRTSNVFSPGICLPSDHVREISDGNLVAFKCSTAEGAILVLPKGATAYEAANKLNFQNHAARHAVSWYKYTMLNEGMDISNGSLYFVTECVKSVDWGIAVFCADQVADDHLRFIVDEGSCRWEHRGKVDARVGPTPKDNVVSDDEEPNQCVFLGGYKIMLRPDIWEKLKNATVVTSQGGEFFSSPSTSKSDSQTNSFHQSSSDNSNASNSSYGTTVASQLMHTKTLPGSPTQGADVPGAETSSQWLGQVILEENFREEAPLHPSDLINLMLLHLKPEAKVALTHDSEWCNHLPRNFITDPVHPNIDGLLDNINQSCQVVIDDNESAVLVDNEMESKVEDNLFSSFLRVPTRIPNISGITTQTSTVMQRVPRSNAPTSPSILSKSLAFLEGIPEDSEACMLERLTECATDMLPPSETSPSVVSKPLPHMEGEPPPDVCILLDGIQADPWTPEMTSYAYPSDHPTSMEGRSSQDHPTPTRDTDLTPGSNYMGAEYTPFPSRPTFEKKELAQMPVSTVNTFGGVPEEDEGDRQYGRKGAFTNNRMMVGATVMDPTPDVAKLLPNLQLPNTSSMTTQASTMTRMQRAPQSYTPASRGATPSSAVSKSLAFLEGIPADVWTPDMLDVLSSFMAFIRSATQENGKHLNNVGSTKRSPVWVPCLIKHGNMGAAYIKVGN